MYAKFGEVAEAAQLLETQLGNMLFLHGVKEEDLIANQRPERAAALLREINRKTLGALLSSPGLATLTAAGLEDLFAEALKERNRLNHGFYREHNLRRNSADGCTKMLYDLERIHDVLLKAYEAAMLLSGTDILKLASGQAPAGHLPI
ncbi:hypothetical protein [Variovorax sp. KK3]|uniref:hypothetical protein n=1 Tax=Variovorax sp. KK3 TaxID=1855728 RepID=UPI001C4E2111|nr:hypothetical protein [Variovorax sp. KK3]